MSKVIADTIQGRSVDPTVNDGLTIAGVTTASGIINASSDVRITGNINAGIGTFSGILNGSSDVRIGGNINAGISTLSGKATVGSVTLQHSNIVSGVVTATTYYGDAANMTNAGISAGKAMGLASFLVY